ncbi:MAG: PepSY domain-containing protein [Thaumarchaeota archaeon]|nr:PepSY domain-containing protein [Nitrososphaerota archaeon]MBI3641376.1 PepSY domain-containing protein [Nitrososphaerota archaeon]
MNQNSSYKTKTMAFLAIIIGAGLVAAFGTLSAAQASSENNTQTFVKQLPSIQGSIDVNQVLMSNVKTKFVDAANTAESAITGGKVVGGDLGVNQGYYVYSFRVMDSQTKIHLLVVDAGNGKILSNTEGFGLSYSSSGIPNNVMFGEQGTMIVGQTMQTGPFGIPDQNR